MGERGVHDKKKTEKAKQREIEESVGGGAEGVG